MKTKLLILLFSALSLSTYAQQYIFGKVSSEFGSELENVIIMNTRTDEKVVSDKDGNYMIPAKAFDELRFVRSGYERNSAKISADHFSKPLNMILAQAPYEIPEIELVFHPTGNLKKDVKSLDPPKRVMALNADLNKYMMTPSTVVEPKLTMPSAFAPPNYNAGQVNMLGIASAISGLLGKAKNTKPTTANYAETQEFYRRIKNTMNLSFYTAQGWTEEDIDRFLIYADDNYSLAKKFRKSFDIGAIDMAMKLAYKEYIKTHKVGS